MLVTERDQLLGPALPRWGFDGVAPAPIKITRWSPALAEAKWRKAFKKYNPHGIY
jgi:hypothetical protein